MIETEAFHLAWFGQKCKIRVKSQLWRAPLNDFLEFSISFTMAEFELEPAMNKKAVKGPSRRSSIPCTGGS